VIVPLIKFSHSLFYFENYDQKYFLNLFMVISISLILFTPSCLKYMVNFVKRSRTLVSPSLQINVQKHGCNLLREIFTQKIFFAHSLVVAHHWQMPANMFAQLLIFRMFSLHHFCCPVRPHGCLTAAEYPPHTIRMFNCCDFRALLVATCIALFDSALCRFVLSPITLFKILNLHLCTNLSLLY
jgi:hypothetical protein